jgi:hypothetical protein
MNLGNVASVFYCGFAPRRAARANLGLSLGQAYVLHWIGMGWLVLAWTLMWAVQGEFDRVDDLLRGWANVHWRVILSTLFVVAFLEVVHLLVGLMLVGPAAQDEPVRNTYRHAQRTVWIHTGQVAWAIPGASILLAWLWDWLEPHREMWYWRREEPTSGPGGLLGLREWVAGHHEIIVYVVVVATIVWVTWGWLRGAMVERQLAPVAHAKLCEYCGYNLSFIEGHERCPECGVALALSLGEHRCATAWACRQRLSPHVWIACAQKAWMQSESFFRTLQTTHGVRPALSFLGWSGLLCACGTFLGIVPVGLIEERTFRNLWEWEAAWLIASLVAAILLVLVCVTGAIVGMFVSRASERNRCASAFQVACYCSGFFPVWVVVSAGLICTTGSILDRLYLFGYQWWVILLWPWLNAVVLILYVGGVARRMKYVRYANS